MSVAGILCAAGLSMLALTTTELAQNTPPAMSPSQSPAPVKQVVESTPAEDSKVIVGVFINDILQLNFPTDSYSIDLYIWFRWKNPDLSPYRTMEFMNRVTPTEHQRDTLFEKPKRMPDGSYYAIIREQGNFSSKFEFARYPFDRQVLQVIFEDTVNMADTLNYVVAAKDAVVANPDIALPGFRMGRPHISTLTNRYATNLGNITLKTNQSYSRGIIEIPVQRQLVTVSIKTFVPILLIIISSTLVLFVRPSIVEGRIGLAITALLTLVALQLTAASTLPDVGYLMLIDKAYLISYAFIIAVLMRVVVTSWVGWEGYDEAETAKRDADWAVALIVSYVVLCAIFAVGTFYMH